MYAHALHIIVISAYTEQQTWFKYLACLRNIYYLLMIHKINMQIKPCPHYVYISLHNKNELQNISVKYLELVLQHSVFANTYICIQGQMFRQSTNKTLGGKLNGRETSYNDYLMALVCQTEIDIAVTHVNGPTTTCKNYNKRQLEQYMFHAL